VEVRVRGTVDTVRRMTTKSKWYCYKERPPQQVRFSPKSSKRQCQGSLQSRQNASVKVLSKVVKTPVSKFSPKSSKRQCQSSLQSRQNASVKVLSKVVKTQSSINQHNYSPQAPPSNQKNKKGIHQFYNFLQFYIQINVLNTT